MKMIKLGFCEKNKYMGKIMLEDGSRKNIDEVNNSGKSFKINEFTERVMD